MQPTARPCSPGQQVRGTHHAGAAPPGLLALLGCSRVSEDAGDAPAPGWCGAQQPPAVGGAGSHRGETESPATWPGTFRKWERCEGETGSLSLGDSAAWQKGPRRIKMPPRVTGWPLALVESLAGTVSASFPARGWPPRPLRVPSSRGPTHPHTALQRPWVPTLRRLGDLLRTQPVGLTPLGEGELAREPPAAAPPSLCLEAGCSQKSPCVTLHPSTLLLFHARVCEPTPLPSSACAAGFLKPEAEPPGLPCALIRSVPSCQARSSRARLHLESGGDSCLQGGLAHSLTSRVRGNDAMGSLWPPRFHTSISAPEGEPVGETPATSACPSLPAPAF